MFSALVPIHLQPTEFWNCDYEDLIMITKSVVTEYKSRMRTEIIQNRILVRDMTRALSAKPLENIETLLPMLAEPVQSDWHRDKQNLMRWVEAQNNGRYG